MPAYFIGLPVTALTDSAAPPLASPSSLVRKTLSMPERRQSFCRVYCVLPRHRVHNQHYLVGVNGGLYVFQLAHQSLVYVQAPGGIKQHHVVAVFIGVYYGFGRDPDGIGGSHLENWDTRLSSHRFKLLYCGGPVNVAGRQQGPLSTLFQKGGKLCGVGGFSRALKAYEHYHGRRLGGHRYLGVFLAHRFRQLVADDLDHHLGGSQALQHVPADGPFAYSGDEILDDLIADVRLEQSEPHVAHSLFYVALRQPALAPELFKRRRELFG
jgi:hypothetical protein